MEEIALLENVIEINDKSEKYLYKKSIDNNINYDEETKKRPTYCTIPLFNSKREYGIVRDVIIFLLGCVLLIPSILVESFEMKWLFLFSSGLMIFIISRLIVYIILNIFLHIFLKFNKLKLYYYTIAWNGNLTLILWSIGMILIIELYISDIYFNINIMSIKIQHITQLFISLIVIGISNAIRIIILDFILDIPSYKNFKNELLYFLKITNGLQKLFGVYKDEDKVKFDSKKKLPKYFELPLISTVTTGNCDIKELIKSTTLINISSRKISRIIGKQLFSLLDDYDENVGVDLDSFLYILDETKANYLENKKNAEELFYLIDKNESGSITDEEFINTCEELYDQYIRLSHGLTTNKTATKALELIIGVIYIFIISFIVMLILEVNVSGIYVSLTSIFVVWAFALSTSITRFIESILFITIYRIFDVGDTVKIGDSILTVKTIQLFNTTFTGSLGESFYISNNLLITTFVQNLHRSRNALVKIEIELENFSNKLNLLTEKIGLYLKKTGEWSTEYDVFIMSSSKDNLKISINLKHNLSWKYNSKILKSKSEFLLNLCDILNEIEIKFTS